MLATSFAADADPEFYERLPVLPGTYSVRLEKSVFVPMRDNVRLSTDLYFPDGAKGELPTVLIRTPYNKNQFREMPEDRAHDYPPKTGVEEWYSHFFASRGFVVAVQDHRGRFESEGEHFIQDKGDAEDGYDTVEWLTRQSWSNQRVGTFGCSYLAETQHRLAALRHPAHVAAIAQAGSTYYGAGGVWNFGFIRYGVTELAASLAFSYYMRSPFPYGPPTGIDREAWFKSDLAAEFDTGPFEGNPPAHRLQAALRTLPIIDALKVLAPSRTEYENWIRFAHDFGNPYWTRTGMISDNMRFNVPTLHVNSWYDITPNSTIELFRLFRENAQSTLAGENQYLIMSAGTHCSFELGTAETIVGDRPVGDTRLNFPGLYLAWFDRWLKGITNSIPKDMPKVTSYLLGKGEWRTYDRWPPSGSRQQRWYLGSAGRANSRYGNGRLALTAPNDAAADDYTYDPIFPTPSVGGGICCAGESVKPGGVDQREIELRNDVLVYTSKPLETGIEVAGRIAARLYVSSDAPDTDFVVKLVDVYPDGTAYIVQEGVARTRFREGLNEEVLMTPGKVYGIDIDLESTHSFFDVGHRIRIDVSSSNFPRWDRNLNTGGSNYDESVPRTAHNRVHYGADHPSHLSLSVID